MQCAAIEFARTKCGMKNATSEEFGENNNNEDKVLLDFTKYN